MKLLHFTPKCHLVAQPVGTKVWDRRYWIGQMITRFPINNGFADKMCFMFINSHRNLTSDIWMGMDNDFLSGSS